MSPALFWSVVAGIAVGFYTVSPLLGLAAFAGGMALAPYVPTRR